MRTLYEFCTIIEHSAEQTYATSETSWGSARQQ